MVSIPRLAVLSLTAALLGCSAPAGGNPKTHTLSTIGSERATSGSGSKIVIRDGRLHVAWQDYEDDGKYTAKIATQDLATGEWEPARTVGVGTDNHARPNIICDDHGYLHLIIAGHWTGLQYARSVRPNDTSEWTAIQTFGKSTYPVMEIGRDGTIYLTARHDNWWQGVDYYTRPPGLDESIVWAEHGRITQKDKKWPGYAGYQTGMQVDSKGTLHGVFDFYEGTGIMDNRGKHQAVCYMASDDGGNTWRKADGTPIKKPALPEGMDVLARDTVEERHEPLPPSIVHAQGSIVVDSHDTPHIFMVSHIENPGELIHASLDANHVWQQRKIDVIHRNYPKMRPIQLRGSTTMTADDSIYLLLELLPLDDRWFEGKWPMRKMWFIDDKRLIWVYSRDGGATWNTRDALPPGTVFHQPNVARAVGGNKLPAGRFPPFIYFDGDARLDDDKKGAQNNVYFVQP